VKTLKIVLDADGVMRNFTVGALAIIKELTGKSFSLVDVTAFNFSKALGLTGDETQAVMTAISTRRGFVTGLPPYPEARQGVRRLRELGDVVCVTSPWESPWGMNPWWKDESEAWLALHFGIDVVHHAHDKSTYEADLFVDDRSKNVRAWSAAWPDRTAVFWRTPHNTSESVPWGAHSTGSWDALYQLGRETALGPIQRSMLPTLEGPA
jgi:5' nucleotidase, deoxy (Pyrimidine), cytosolic type C protein (NT5C)